MFQTFETTSRPENALPRLAALRAELAREGLSGFLIPRADAHQGEYVAPRDERLAWLTGFTGSAGNAVVLEDTAAVVTDGRYKVQVREQLDAGSFETVITPGGSLSGWIDAKLGQGDVADGSEARIGFDPWLHSVSEIEKLRKALEPRGIALLPWDNLVDRIWDDQPEPPMGEMSIHPLDLAGESHDEKRARIGRAVAAEGAASAVITLPDSIAWLLNIRGSDIVRNPVPHAFAILHAGGTVDLFSASGKMTQLLREHLGDEIAVHAPEAFSAWLGALDGPVLVDPASLPVAAWDAIGAKIVRGSDPVSLPKARKNPAELAGMAAAHVRDGAAMARFLAWIDREAPSGTLTEIAIATRLEEERAADPTLRDISFETIVGSGPHGAMPHYRVNTESDRTVMPGDVLLVDSGGQYSDGTTDITRTVAVGEVPDRARRAFTLVLKGMIAISRARWPKGLAGRDLDPLARAALWRAGLDFDHGTGHGVGAYLSVHEGPQRLSRTSEVPLETGMILSNEPGYYDEGEFGIRIENLVSVIPAPALPGADDREMLSFSTLTFAPIDRRMIEPALLDAEERSWLDAYHAEVAARIGPLLDASVSEWLDGACRPL
ncbi:aminopeptidase P family protein [Roseicyclus sp. F158]|uniref:Aminopeptidase P family protein n=1 Tax=Tropicimonas omnivorans TaxID=3075590 RepID=A0ABU3DHR0_9RHOB|nr:aminopeptidase P family protein [Roseicyclus sp. F158]MDT0682692.1 aminopeptidase P family protein [Roseicyclus sp. F158]